MKHVDSPDKLPQDMRKDGNGQKPRGPTRPRPLIKVYKEEMNPIGYIPYLAKYRVQPRIWGVSPIQSESSIFYFEAKKKEPSEKFTFLKFTFLYFISKRCAISDFCVYKHFTAHNGRGNCVLLKTIENSSYYRRGIEVASHFIEERANQKG